MKEERQNLTAKNEALQAELDFTRNQLEAKKTQVGGSVHSSEYLYIPITAEGNLIT